MHKWQVFINTMITDFSVVVYSDTKSKATYAGYKAFKGKELEEYTSFQHFLKYFYVKTVLVD